MKERKEVGDMFIQNRRVDDERPAELLASLRNIMPLIVGRVYAELGHIDGMVRVYWICPSYDCKAFVQTTLGH